MKRRAFLTLLGCAAAAWPHVVRSQPRMPVVGFLSSESPDNDDEVRAAFRRGLTEQGYVEGRNVGIEYRWAQNQYERLPAMAADLVRRQVAVIASFGGIPGARAAKAATTTIPIVFMTGADPIAFGLVTSLSHPGGNLTGATSLSDEIAPKRLELMHEVVPSTNIMALLINPTNPNSEPQAKDLQAAARALGLDLQILRASSDGGYEAAFANADRLHAGALVIGPDTFLRSHASNQQLALLAARHGIPAVSFTRQFVEDGGLMSYGDTGDSYRLVGSYVGRILKGEKPGDLPVQQGTKIELNINLRAAKALGITIPITLLGRADGVIE
jgi:putative ABC transport system substrate-binding protein